MKTSRTKVVLLGTGNPNPDPYHSGPSVAVVVDNTPYLIDIGPGIVRQAAALTPRYGGTIPGLDSKNLKKAFLTHLHSDHTVGFPDLILTPWVMGRDEALDVFGPKGTKDLTEHIIKAFQADIQYRINSLEPINNNGWRVKCHEINEGRIYSDENVEVEAFRVDHGTWQNAFGFRFVTPDKVIVISGDTAPCENMYKYSKDIDILIHEAYRYKGFHRLEPSWQKYHKTHHTSTLELGDISKTTNPGKLVVYHTLYWGGTDDDILGEIKCIYTGEVLVGSDLQIIQ